MKFTGGVGENSSNAWAEICRGLQILGICINMEKNKAPGPGDAVNSEAKSPVKVVVVAADEELETAHGITLLVDSQK